MCMIENADGTCLVLSDRNYKARKTHKCAECGRVIGIGETYRVERLVFYNEASTHKTCPHCVIVRDWLNGECGGFLYGGIEEDILEHVHYGGYGIGVGRLAAGMCKAWRNKDGQVLALPKMPLTTHEKVTQGEGV